MLETRYEEKRNVTYKYTYEFAGFGIDAQPIYKEYCTKFSIAKGVIENHKFVRLVDKNENTYNSFVR